VLVIFKSTVYLNNLCHFKKGMIGTHSTAQEISDNFGDRKAV
jgi:hypothetical protein